MIATPDQRNRLMQKLKAETWVRRKSGSLDGAERVKRKQRTSVPRSLGFFALMPIPVNKSYCWGSAFTEPQPGPWPRKTTLRLLPGRALSFAPAACSVSMLVIS